MRAQDLLKKCFGCKSVSDCWAPEREFASDPINSKDVRLATRTLDLKALKVDTLHRFHIATVTMYINTVSPGLDGDTLLDIVNTSVFITEALTNSSNEAWNCPPDHTYEPQEQKV